MELRPVLARHRVRHVDQVKAVCRIILGVATAFLASTRLVVCVWRALLARSAPNQVLLRALLVLKAPTTQTPTAAAAVYVVTATPLLSPLVQPAVSRATRARTPL
jgi:hypothetical protein